MVGMKGTPSVARARALALAAVRETFEEAGLLIGTPLGRRPRRRPATGRISSPPASGRPGPAHVLCARDHAAGPAAPVRHPLFLRRGRGHRPQGRRSPTASCRTSNGIPSPRPDARIAEHHAGRAGGSGRAHRRRRVAHGATCRCRSIIAPQRQTSAATLIGAATSGLTNSSQRTKVRASSSCAPQPIKALTPWPSRLPRRSSC